MTLVWAIITPLATHARALTAGGVLCATTLAQASTKTTTQAKRVAGMASVTVTTVLVRAMTVIRSTLTAAVWQIRAPIRACMEVRNDERDPYKLSIDFLATLSILPLAARKRR